MHSRKLTKRHLHGVRNGTSGTTTLNPTGRRKWVIRPLSWSPERW